MKKNVLIIFGGRSGEHEVSVRSAQSIEKNIDTSLYETHCLGITHYGQWRYGNTIQEITDGVKVLPASEQLALPENTTQKQLTMISGANSQSVSVDVIFPIIHGPNGEDGTLQGMLELANLPYVGPGVLGSAVSMDKVIQKQLCELHGIPQARYEWFSLFEWQHQPQQVMEKVNTLTYPLFIKPANMGSSVGISKVKQADDLVAAITDAFKYDTKVIVEEGIPEMMEIEVSLLGNHQPIASVCGSVKPNTEFYDYETKYITDDIEATIPALISQEASDNIRHAAVETFKLLNCFGLARIDFFYQPTTGKYYLNEINTLPGFTSISMYPKLWEATGISYSELINKLIELAEERWQEKQHISYKYLP